MKNKVVTARLNRGEMIVRTAGVLTLAGFGPGMAREALAQTSASVVVTPEETEGPYWVDEQFLARGDERHIEAGRRVHHSFGV